MRFMVEMTVSLPPGRCTPSCSPASATYSQALQRDGRWEHLWRVAGRYANVSIFSVGSADELHELVSGLPLFPYMDIRVTALAAHPSAIAKRRRR